MSQNNRTYLTVTCDPDYIRTVKVNTDILKCYFFCIKKVKR